MNNSLQEGGRRAEERGQPRGLGGWLGQGQGGRGPAPRAGASLRQLQRAECWSLRGEQRARLRGAGRTSKPGPVFPLCWGGGSSGQPAKVVERLRGDNGARRKWAGPAPPGAWRREHSLSHPGRDMGAWAWGTGAWAWDVGAGRARGAGARAWDPGQDVGPGGASGRRPQCVQQWPHDRPLAPLSGVLWLLVSLGSWSDHPRPGQRGGQGEVSPAVLHRARGRDSLFLRLAQPEL